MSAEIATVQAMALTVTQRAKQAIAVTKTRDELQALATSTANIISVTNADGREQVHAAMMVLKNTRCEIQRLGKEAREDATKFQKAVIAEEKLLIEILSPEETRLSKLRDDWDSAREAEKQALVDAEIARVAAIDARIETIRNWPTQYTGKPSSLVEPQVRVATDYQIDEFFEEKADTARAVLEASRAALVGILAERQAHEAEQARVAAQLEELAILKRQEEARQETARIAAAEEERKAKVARDAEAAEQAKAQERTQIALSEIQGIQHQVMIASVGRKGVREGGTIECIRETLAETEAWSIDDRFGVFFGSAQQAKESAIAAIKAQLESAEQQAELDRIQRERDAAYEAQQAEIRHQQAELERQQEEFRRSQEPEVIVLQTSEPHARPTDDEMLGTLCATYGADRETVIEWILSMDLSERKAAA